MKRKNLYSVVSITVMSALILICCTKDNNNNDDPEKYSIGGTVEGLVESGLVLQNKASDDLSISENGIFTFPTKLEDSSAYEVTIESYPLGQTCYVENASGTIDGADISNVNVVCETAAVAGDCSNGQIVYSHNVSNDYGLFHQGIIVTGTVPFTCDEQGGLSGSGTLLISVEGSITGDCELITYSGTADLNVSLTGQYSIAQVTVNLTETWYVGSPTASGTYDDLCGDNDGPYAFPMIEATNNHTLNFPNIDGYTIESNYEGASGTGTYSWTLNIE